MKWSVVNTPIGLSKPFGVPAKCEGLSLGTAALVAGISATSSLGASAFNNYMSDLRSDRQFYRTQDLMDKEMQQRKELFDYENLYKSPKEQMARYREAGLNPYLMAHENDIGAAGGSIPAAGGAPNVPVAQTFPYSNEPIVSGISQMLATGSQIKLNDAEAFSKIVDSLPTLGESMGWSQARKVAKDLLGIVGISSSQHERKIDAIIEGMESENRSKAVKASMDEAFGMKLAEQRWASGEQAISESFARVGKMSSDAKVNESMIKKLASDIVRNVADAWKLRKEGEKYVADAKTINALRSFVVSQSRSYANMLNLNSYLSGAEEGTDLFDFKHSGSYAKNKVEAERIRMTRHADAVWTAVDKFFDDYVKIMGSPSAGGSSSETMYTSPQPRINGF